MPLMELRDFIDTMERLDLGLGVLLIMAGLVFIVVGGRIFKVLLTLSCGTVGFVACFAALPWETLPRVLAGVTVGIGLGVASGFLVRSALTLLAGGWAGLVLGTLGSTFGVGDAAEWVLAGAAFIVAVSLVFIYYQEVIALVMSFEGTLLFLSGMIALLSRVPVLWTPIRPIFQDAPLFSAFAVLAGTVTGYYLQIAEMQKKKLGTSG